MKPRDYVFYVERWTVKGVRDIERMVYCARSALKDSEFLDDADAELLVTTAAKLGSDWLSAGNEVDTRFLGSLLGNCVDDAEKRYEAFVVQVENENNDRADLQEKALNLHLERQRQKLFEVLCKHEERGNSKMIAPTRGLLEKIETRVRDKMRTIEERRRLEHHRKEVCLGIVRLA